MANGVSGSFRPLALRGPLTVDYANDGDRILWALGDFSTRCAILGIALPGVKTNLQ